MKTLLVFPHRICESTCYSNGLEDILAWKGAKYSDFLLPLVGGMASFTYLRFKLAQPPCQVYWGANTRYLMKDLAKIIGFHEIVLEGRAFKGTFSRLRDFIDNGQPVVAGALDMYYLPYYPDLYGRQHMPIHYVLVVGYDDDGKVVFIQDCSLGGVQAVSYHDFEKSLDVNVPGMSKRNTIRAFALPAKLPSEFDVAKRGFSLKAAKFLNPPVRFFGIPAMRRLADDILAWDNKKSFEHMVMYATTPPQLPKTFENSHGMRFWQADLLNRLGNRYNVSQWMEASALFKDSGRAIMRLCEVALAQDRDSVSKELMRIAEIEGRAYTLIKDV